MKRIILGLVLTAAAGFLVLASCGGGKTTVKEEVAYVFDIIVGDVTISGDNGTNWKPAAPGDAVKQADIVKTGPASYCDILMPQRGIFRVEASTVVYISKLQKQLEQLEVRSGKVAVKVSTKLTEGENFLVETKSGVAAVRGTEFVVENMDGVMNTSVNEGEVKVAPVLDIEGDSNVIKTVQEELTVSVTSNETVSFDEKENKEISKDVSALVKDIKEPGKVAEVLDKVKNRTRGKKRAMDKDKDNKVFQELRRQDRLEKIKEMKRERALDKQDKELEKQRKKEARELEEQRKELERQREMEKKELEQNVKDIQDKTGHKGIAKDKVTDEPLTKQQEEDELSRIKDKAKDRAGISKPAATNEAPKSMKDKMQEYKNRKKPQ